MIPAGFRYLNDEHERNTAFCRCGYPLDCTSRVTYSIFKALQTQWWLADFSLQKENIYKPVNPHG
jgi:hypothetical protein